MFLALIDMGEIYGFDNANQREWNVSIRNPDQEDQILTTIAMKNQRLPHRAAMAR